ncbi:MAG: phosphopyruvate hydratase [Patescibacteria group bacterium]|nr:phosphopyruvate hydratase [Patescibacteria group bacterium]MDD5715192.1 phosphopyruvate hydratase [Patescibacteria group bacterium]
MQNKIKQITAREVLASGGKPTIEAHVIIDNGIVGSASVPYGVSAGTHEALTMLDGDKKRYDGGGMLKACKAITGTLGPALKGMAVTSQETIDQTMIELDGTPQKSKYGGNSILAVSLACARAAALALHEPLYAYIRRTYKLPYKTWKLPRPMMVVIEGGAHADNSTDFQEYLLSVSGAPTAREAVRWGEEAYGALKSILKKQGFNTNVGNEGAFAPSGIETNEQPLRFLTEAIEKAGYAPGKDISISLDPATSELYEPENKRYVLKREGAGLSTDQMIGLFRDWISKYPIITLEDGLAEDDWDGWISLFAECGKKIRIIGDDLTVTNPERVQMAIDRKAINAVLIKLNQIGTLSETMKTIKLGRAHDFWQVVSHRGGGETNDSFMVDVAAAANAEYIKVGPVRGERTSKYNRLMEIEEELHGK